MTQQPPRPLAPTFVRSDLKFYAHLFWRWLWLILLCALFAGGMACLVSANTAPIYQAASKVMINEGRSASITNYNDILTSERVARTYADLMRRDSMLRETFVRLGLDPALMQEQVTNITITPVRDTQLVHLTMEGPDPDLVAAVTNTLPQVFLDELHKIQVSRFAESKASLSQQLDELSRQVETTKLQIDSLQERRTAQEEIEYDHLSGSLAQYQSSYASLLQSYEQLRLTEAQSLDTIVLVEPAAVPVVPVRPRALVNTLLAAILGALGALGLVFFVEYLDDRVQTPEDLRRIADVPVLGAIGMTPGAKSHDDNPRTLVSLNRSRHPVMEAYRRLRTNLQYYNLDSGLKSLAVISAEPGEGKSVCSANLAVVMAQSGLSVVLVDGDLRRPRQHHIFGLQERPGLAEALVTGRLDELPLQKVAEVPTLCVVAAGERIPNPAEVLGSQRMRQLYVELARRFDVVIIDTPPLLAVTDAQIIGRLVDGALLVVNTRKTASAGVYRTLEALAQVNVPLIGVVLNQLSGRGRGYYYYHSDANDYYHAEDSPGKPNGKQLKERGERELAADN